MPITATSVSNARLWSSRRCLMVFLIALGVFGGLVGAGSHWITVQPVYEAGFAVDEHGGYVKPVRDDDFSGLSLQFVRTVKGERYSEHVPLVWSHGRWRPELTKKEFAGRAVVIGEPIRLWRFALKGVGL